MEGKNIYTEEQMDFIIEMMNIGAGNAVTALSQMLHIEINVRTPWVHILSDSTGLPALFHSTIGVTGVKMKLVGDIQGDAYLFIADELRQPLVLLAEKAMTGRNVLREADEINEFNLSVLSEIGNILTGVYMNAIYEFCKLRIYHSVPVLIMGTAKSIIDGLVASKGHGIRSVIVIKNELKISEMDISTWFMFATSDENITALTKAIEKARFH